MSVRSRGVGKIENVGLPGVPGVGVGGDSHVCDPVALALLHGLAGAEHLARVADVEGDGVRSVLAEIIMPA